MTAILDRTTKMLFNRFPREMGLPWRVPVSNWKEVMRIVNENNGIRDVFISLYDTKYYVIDKIFFDLDILDLKLAGKFYLFLKEKGFSVIPFFSGKKGFHFFVLLKPFRFRDLDQAKAVLRRVSFTLVDEAGMYKKVSKGEYEYKVSLLDSKVFGDIKKFARFPNTLRPPENVTYATYLPDDFYTMSWEEFFEWVKHTHYDMQYEIKLNYRIIDIETTDAFYDYMLIPQTTYSQITTIRETTIKDKDRERLYRYLSKILRPCILRHLFTEDPPHDIRTAATIDLMWAGFTVEDIVEIYRKIGWVDFNERITEYQVRYIFRRGLYPYSCRKLKQLGYCNLPEDEYCDFWD